MKNLISSSASQPPDNINDIFPLEKMNKEIANDVWKAIKSINEVVFFNDEEDHIQFSQGCYTEQVLRFSLSTIEELTSSKPNYIIEIIDTFRLEEYFEIPDRIYINAGISIS